MVIFTPKHLFNNDILVISGGVTYNADAEEVMNSGIVGSGTGRLEVSSGRIVTTAGILTTKVITMWVEPGLDIAVGNLANVDGDLYKINSVITERDADGRDRIKEADLSEISE